MAKRKLPTAKEILLNRLKEKFEYYKEVIEIAHAESLETIVDCRLHQDEKCILDIDEQL